MNSTSTSRRNFLKIGAGTAGALLVSSQATHVLAAASCGPTPAQTSGPFYPGETAMTVGSDLTMVNGKRALGQVIYVKGRVLDLSCQPVVGASVEIWQACVSGRYNNPRDPNPAPLDPNFKYWAEVYSDANGEYIFKTILPGAYPADTDWTRPPHIHFKIAKLGYKDLVTQLYFAGDALNNSDLILQQIPVNERGSVIVDFMPSASDLEPGSLTGTFDITIQKVRA